MQIFVKTLIERTSHLRLVGVSHDNSPPRTTTFRLAFDYLLARVVPASDYSFPRVVYVSD
jgi:hypothetical protein